MRVISTVLAVIFSFSLLVSCSSSSQTERPEAGLQSVLAGKILALHSGLYAQPVTQERIVNYLQLCLKRARPVESLPQENLKAQTVAFQLADGSWTKEFPYKFNDLVCSKPGYIQFLEGWYEVPGEFNAVWKTMAEYAHCLDQEVDPGDEAFLKDYGWTPLFLINKFDLNIPTFRHRPGEYPLPIYWAYNNELSKDIGLDLTAYQNQSVRVVLYKLAELLPESMEPRRECGRVVLVRSQNRVVGAWLDAGRHYSFATSLRGRSMEESSGKTWGQWIPSFIETEDPLEKSLATMDPTQVVQTFYEAINSKDYRTAHACESRRTLTGYLFANMDNELLYNPNFGDEEATGWSNILSAQVTEMHKLNPPDSEENQVSYQVKVELQVKEEITFKSGLQTLFLTLKRESADTGWRIESISTGP